MSHKSMKGAMSRNKTLRIQKGGKVKYSVKEKDWYTSTVNRGIFGMTPRLNETDMKETYTNRREHLTNWMCELLAKAPTKSTFLICNEKKTSEKGDLQIKDNVYLSQIPTISHTHAIKKLSLVDYYAFDYGSESDVMKKQADPQFLESPKFLFDEPGYVDITQYNFHQMNASGNDNSCGFFALLQAISPLYRALNYPAKIHITREFRNSYVPEIIVNKNGAPMSTKEYKTSGMGGDATTNELDTIRAKYNDVDSETTKQHKLIEYLNGSQKTQFTGVSMHIRNSWFFGYNMVSISARTQSNNSGEYKFFKDEIEGPERVDETILICNRSSAHYMTIGVKNASGKMDFVFDENDANIKQMIDTISVKGTATDIVGAIEDDLTFEDIELKHVDRRVLNDEKTNSLINIILYAPKDGSSVFPKAMDSFLMELPVFTDNKTTLGTDPSKILCLAFDQKTKKYYYVLSYGVLSEAEKHIGIYNVASINKVDKKLTISNNYVHCGTIQYNNKNDDMVVKLDGCDLPKSAVALGPDPGPSGGMSGPDPALSKTTTTTTINPGGSGMSGPATTTTAIPASTIAIPASTIAIPASTIAIPASTTAIPAPTAKNETQICNFVKKAISSSTGVKSASSSPSSSSLSLSSSSFTPASSTTCFILVKFNKDPTSGTIDVESVETEFTDCTGAELFTGDFTTIDPAKEYLFQFDLDPANPHASNVTHSANTTTCTPALNTQLDSLFAS